MYEKQLLSFKRKHAIGSKKQILPFTDLTLFKPDIEKLIHLFQNHLQDVEIIIDDHLILDSNQLEQFESSYQAQSLLARGYWPGAAGEEASNQGERLLIELKMSKAVAHLTSWNTISKSEFMKQLRRVLLVHHTFVQQTLQWTILYLMCGPFLMIVSLLEHLPIHSILPVLIAVGTGILTIPACAFLFGFIVTQLDLQTRNFLFPGETTSTRRYHLSGMVSRFVAALLLMLIFDGIIFLAFRLLWR